MLPRLFFFFCRQTRHADYYHIGIITIGTGMLDTILGLEITSVFIKRTRDKTYINSSFLNVNHA